MKKLIIISILLVTSNIICAGVSLSNDPVIDGFNQSFDVFINSDGSFVNHIMLSLDPSAPYWISDISHHPDYSLTDWGLGDGLHWWELMYIGSTQTESLSVLFQMHIDFQLEHGGYTFNLYDTDISETQPVDSIHFPATPEPGSLVLLALGGLVLRRRK